MYRLEVGLMLGLAACARWSASPGVGAEELQPRGGDSVLIEVSNQNFYDATISYRYFGTSHRLGTVSGHTVETFVVRYEPAQLVIIIQLIGTTAKLTDQITVSPGDRIQVTIPADAHRRSDLRVSRSVSFHRADCLRQYRASPYQESTSGAPFT